MTDGHCDIIGSCHIPRTDTSRTMLGNTKFTDLLEFKFSYQLDASALGSKEKCNENMRTRSLWASSGKAELRTVKL